jgi:hypothetical protein
MIMQGLAALRDFGPADVRIGSKREAGLVRAYVSFHWQRTFSLRDAAL